MLHKLAEDILGLVTSSDPDVDLLRLKKKEYLDQLSDEKDINNIRSVISLDDEHLIFPVVLKNKTFEKLMELGEREPSWIEKYAWHLQMHGPDWDEKAEELLSLAKNLRH